jgi:hypothetical protein
MSQVYDLDLFTGDTYTIVLNGEEFKLPKQPNTMFSKKITALQEKIASIAEKKPSEANDLLNKCAAEILNQDETKEIDIKFIENKLNVVQVRKIVEIYFKELKESTEKN